MNELVKQLVKTRQKHLNDLKISSKFLHYLALLRLNGKNEENTVFTRLEPLWNVLNLVKHHYVEIQMIQSLNKKKIHNLKFLLKVKCPNQTALKISDSIQMAIMK